MAKILNTYEFTLPLHVLLIDANGIDGHETDDDIRDYDYLVETMNDFVGGTPDGKHWTMEYPECIDTEKYFAHYNDCNSLGGDVVDVNIHIFGD